MRFVRHDPRVAGDVGDGEFIRDELAPFEPLVQHAVQARRFLHIAVDRIGQFLRRVHREVPVLARHGAEPAHLPEEPLRHHRAAAQVLGPQAAGLLCNVLQHRARFEDRERLAAIGRIVIDHRRDLVVGRNGEVRGRKLLAL